MATGINTSKLSTLKIDLLGCIESINSLSTRLDDCIITIKDSINAPGRKEIIDQLNAFIKQFSRVNSNINGYIQVINKIEKKFQETDFEAASTLIQGIDKLGQ